MGKINLSQNDNRWGGDLKAAYTKWVRPKDHPFVYTGEKKEILDKPSSSTSKTGKRSLVGGYHDAGDFDQRPSHTVVPQLLLRAYELKGSLFKDKELKIPESGNGLPDFLDEALWGVKAWEQLQESDGGVRAGVESHRHPWGIYFAHTDPLPYWTYARDPLTTARAAGVFAQAAWVLQKLKPTRSARLRQRAIKAWEYAKKHGATANFMLYASSELYPSPSSIKNKNDPHSLPPHLSPLPPSHCSYPCPFPSPFSLPHSPVLLQSLPRGLSWGAFCCFSF